MTDILPGYAAGFTRHEPVVTKAARVFLEGQRLASAKNSRSPRPRFFATLIN
jgi:hypothetical protein